MMPKTVQTMALAYQQICEGEDPWTALGNFTNAWYDYAKGIRAALVSEPLIKPKQDSEHTHHWRAFCAASVEFLCDRYGVPCPQWVQEPDYVLPTPWYGDNIINLADTVALQHRIKTSPAPFAQRNVFCGNRLFQNKYEMNEWAQEARTKGISNPREIWRYARQKETTLHGA
ncbi:MAG TPA: hypothetical protein VJ761_17900 [Ktedonobacteraceae bacterium]|nr:hypothetical protein [Ktedonobacteraceae bacterium]